MKIQIQYYRVVSKVYLLYNYARLLKICFKLENSKNINNLLLLLKK